MCFTYAVGQQLHVLLSSRPASRTACVYWLTAQWRLKLICRLRASNIHYTTTTATTTTTTIIIITIIIIIIIIIICGYCVCWDADRSVDTGQSRVVYELWVSVLEGR